MDKWILNQNVISTVQYLRAYWDSFQLEMVFTDSQVGGGTSTGAAFACSELNHGCQKF